MIGQKHRFHGHSSLRYVYSNGRTVRGQDLAIRFANNPKRSSYRCAVVVSKKVSKSAVKRNRIRRRLYEVIRNNQELLEGTPDIVITVFTEGVAVLEYEALNKTILRLLSGAGLLKISTAKD